MLREVDGLPGAPWRRQLAGALDELVVESELLVGNPLGDPHRRPLYVYRPPGAAAALPAVYVLQGYGGQVDGWLGREAFTPTLIERLDQMFAAGESPAGIVVFIDAWTSLGGSQFLNSPALGPYMDYICDEIVPFVDERYATLASRDHRGIAGKSSGGYGAMVIPMLRPDAFGAFASHAADALFECAYLPCVPAVVRAVREHFGGSFEAMIEHIRGAESFDWDKFGGAFSVYAYAAAYSPDPDSPGKVRLPFDVATGQLIDEVWTQWLAHDPVRMVARHADALRTMRRIYLDAGRSDEFYLDLGAQAFSRELDKLGVAHTLELFDGTHGGFSHRYPGAIRELLLALAR